MNDGSSIHIINKLLPYIASETHVNEYDNNLNNLSLNDINSRFSSVKQQDNELSRKNSYSKQHIKNNEYSIVRIPDFETASKYSKYTSWCVTHHKSMYDSYTHNGLGLFYFCLKSGFENVEKKQGENAPLDEYGLSMIAVSVDEEGEVNTITSRWNHDMEGNDHIMSKDELEDLLGVNFYETFKPYSDEELLKKGYVTISKLKKLLSNGENPSDIFKNVRQISDKIFVYINNNDKVVIYNSETKKIPEWINKWLDYVYKFNNGFAEVGLDGKSSLIYTDGNIIGDGKMWFDWIGEFNDEIAMVQLNDKRSLINTKGELIHDGKAWFDLLLPIDNGFYIVELNGKNSFIDSKGQLIDNGEMWFDDVSSFTNGFAIVKKNDKYSLINTKGELIYDGNAWFDWLGSFDYGFSMAKLNDKFSLINSKGKLIYDGNAWFDLISKFIDGFSFVFSKEKMKWSFINKKGRLIGDGKIWFDKIGETNGNLLEVELNGKKLYIDKDFNFYDIDTKQPIKNQLSNENSDKIGAILRECINIYLNRM